VEETRAIANRSGERTAAMPDQFALREIFIDRTAMHADELEFLSFFIKLMDGAGGDLFARSRLALNEHRGIADTRGFEGAVQDERHARRASHQS